MVGKLAAAEWDYERRLVSDADEGGSAESTTVVLERGRCGCWRGCSADVGRRPSRAMAGCVGAESAAVVPNPRCERAESMAGGARGRQLLARARAGARALRERGQSTLPP
jgi:hypothetical protein